MKRVDKSPVVPARLHQFALAFPLEKWERFRRHSRRGYREVKKQILLDQRGLCAYCEIPIKLTDNDYDIDDFRVEHFYPKSATSEEGANWHLDWFNMLGVCHGGSQKEVVDASWRYSARHIDRSCDVPKGGKDLSEIILNPLQIPAEVRLFRYDPYNGRILVDPLTCPEALQVKAEQTIKELNLNAPRLSRMRLTVLQALQDKIALDLEQGLELEASLTALAQMLLVPDHNGFYQAFFTVVRWYLGEVAEKFLAQKDYKI
ncbi:MAG: retron system putative HNH endonuclease [Acidaminococcaceae bacterium]